MDSYQNDGGVREVDFQVCSLKHFFIQETVRFTNSFRNCGEQDATSCKTPKWPESKWYTRKDTFFGHSFPYPSRFVAGVNLKNR